MVSILNHSIYYVGLDISRTDLALPAAQQPAASLAPAFALPPLTGERQFIVNSYPPGTSMGIDTDSVAMTCPLP